MRMNDAGIIQKFFQDEMDKVAIITKTKSKAKPVPLTPYHLEGPLIVFGIMSVVSVLLFTLEFLNARLQKSSNQMRTDYLESKE